MLLVPRVRQPDRVACLPTCVWAVLTFQGRSVEYEEILDACQLDARGALEPVALQGLADAGLDVDVLADFDPEMITAALAEERPLIVSLPLAQVGEYFFYHAVVVCDLTPEVVVMMDPQLGDYVTLPLSDPRLNGGLSLAGGFFIGHAALSSAAARGPAQA